MSLALGVDTGGTYTDAVLMRDETEIVAAAKALTTRHDLAVGIGAAVEQVLVQAGVEASDIGLASLSTTLATNALVEGQGGRVGLVLIGFGERDLERHGLVEALAGDPVLILAGGHDHAGVARAELDLEALRDWAVAQDVTGFAVAAQFATRNPEHEKLAKHVIAEATGKPVSSSHHLSSKLNGPKRALTALLNARLIGMIDQLLSQAEARLRELGVTAPLMVVRGDGALISAAVARQRPIETILSGPAASLVGAKWLTGIQDALVSDIGGTTTDVALLQKGRPRIDSDGARVGPYRTMVEAVAMRTTGLGGDSEVQFVGSGLQGGVALGPRRVVPVSLLATEAPDVVLPALETQLARAVPAETDGQFVRAISGSSAAGLTDRESALLVRIGESVHPLADVLVNRVDKASLRRLVERGLVQLSGLTPTDAAHVLGLVSDWDRGAAEAALLLMARRRTGAGVILAESAEDMARIVLDQLTEQTMMALLEVAIAEDGYDFGASASEISRSDLLRAGLAGHSGVLQIKAGLGLPVVGLGASASSYYPTVGTRLNCEMVLPNHAGVANAIGAVVGRVTVRKAGTVTMPTVGEFLVDGDKFTDVNAAMATVEDRLRSLAVREAQNAGAEGIRVTAAREIKTAEIEGDEVFVEASIHVEASGRPRIATD